MQRTQTGGVEWDFVYDNAGTLVGAARDDIYQAKYKYDAAGRLTALMRTADGNSRHTGFAYNKFGQAANVKITGSSAEINEANTFDALGRLTEKRWTKGSDQAFAEYTYKAGATANSTSTQLDTVEFGSGESTVDAGRKYLYDNVGNIIEEQHLVNGNYTGKIWYTYDAASQLVRVIDNINNETVQYTYDDQGNITSRTVDSHDPDVETYTDTWTYGGPDGNTLLTSIIDGVTTNYSYPNYGIPSNWTNDRTLTWRNGRTLASIGNTSFTYDGEGQRVSKTTGNVTTEYIYEGDKLVMQKQGSTSLFFLYDTSGIFGFDLITNGNTTGTYYYRTDGKGEIIGITDTSGNVVANYTYDAWGNPTAITDANGNTITSSTHIGIVNPIRYKGYCYDTETGLYYLNSRYYDPEVCRFINADDVSLLGADGSPLSYNLFAYCLNDPINRSDDTGMASLPNWAKGVLAATAVVASVALIAAITVSTAGAGTAAALIAVGAAKGAAIGMASGAAIGAAAGAVVHRVSTGTWIGAKASILNGLGAGALSGSISGAIAGAASNAIKVGRAARAWDKGTFRSGYQSLKYHYNEHVLKEGLEKGNNVLKYTQDAVNFSIRNSSALKYTFNYKYGNASWNLTYSGQGGMFTSAGKIITFWYGDI